MPEGLVVSVVFAAGEVDQGGEDLGVDPLVFFDFWPAAAKAKSTAGCVHRIGVAARTVADHLFMRGDERPDEGAHRAFVAKLAKRGGGLG